MDTQLPARFANRKERRQIAASVVTGLGSASPPYVSIKGGSFTLVDANGEQEPVESKYLDCVIFDTSREVPIQRVFWGKDRPFDPNADAYVPPDCFSDNGIGASRSAVAPQSASCQTCQWNVWGSAVSRVSGKGVKACHAIKKVAVIVPGWDFPFLLRVPVMSHENLRVYGDKFRGQEFDVSEVITRVSLVHGAVGQLDFQALGFTDDETEALVQKVLASHITDALIGRGDLVVQGALPAPGLHQDPALNSPPQSLQAQPLPVSNVQPNPPSVLPADPPKQKRTRKPAESAVPAPFAGPAQAQPGDGSIPPFLRRQQAVPAHGIQSNVPTPTAELEAQLNSVFGLKT